MTKQLKYRFKLSFTVFINLIIISLFVGFIASVIYFSIRAKNDPFRQIGVDYVHPEGEHKIPMNIYGGYLFDSWDNLWYVYLSLGITFYALQLAYLIVLKNKMLHSFFPLFFLTKIKLDTDNKTIFIIFSTLAWLLFIALLPIFIAPFWWCIRDIIQAIVAIAISCLIIIWFAIVWGIQLNDFIKSQKLKQ
ncbi:hypothetical protein [Mycoplasma seminis]|uniref:DUF2975 domain-containing protein n=1 Tax=Mycoplasma seminis TaxID=512749 RepID=A0ABY9HBE0_9MOLU|nr:hypothetical protein [Mycoplasma seminis]WLP85663.1 hypothetical protein Q8852_00680 [Mycoplasma seminis]